jgi:hypothetical protein
VPPVHPDPPPKAKRVSHETAVLEALCAALADFPIEGVSGQGGENRFGIEGWELSKLQEFQFGDLRIELPHTTVLVETESAGGVSNLAKCWPLLHSGVLSKRLVLAHLFMISSAGDYLAHRRLWEFLVDRMAADLDSVGLIRPDHWEARLFTYRSGDPLDDVIHLLRINVMDGRPGPESA